MLLEGILFVLGFPALIKGADLLVDGSSSIAKRLKVSDLVIGLTIVSFGTSAPELIVNVLASFSGATDLAISNVLGSNIANILLILGTAALITPLVVKSNTVWKEIPLGLLSVMLLFALGNDVLMDPSGQNAIGNVISRADGFVFLAFFVVFMYYTFGLVKASKDKVKKDEDLKKMSWSKSWIYILIGGFGLAFGGKWIVDGAIAIASFYELPEALVGVTIVAIGTSLPELATSVVAAMRNNADIAIGNVAGSNIFNVFWILGISSLISPLPYNPAESDLSAWIAILAAALLFVFLLLGKKHVLSRWQGGVFLMLYFGYMIYLIVSL